MAAEINDIVSKQAIDGIKAADTALIAFDATMNKTLTELTKFTTELKKQGISYKDLATISKAMSEEKKRANETEKQATKILQAAERAEKARVAALDKAIAKEKEHTAALKLEVKTMDEALRQNKALNIERKKVDATTKQGQKAIADYNKKIDENTKLIQKNATAEGKRTQGIGLYTQSIVKAVAIIGVAIGAAKALWSTISGSVKLFDTQSRAIAQMNAALKSTKGVSGQTSDALQKQASALQKVTRIGDEMTISAQAMLLTFTNVRGEVFEKSIPLIQDMATAMAMATGAEVDLKSTTLQLGKALNDPIGGINALRRVGVAFSDEQKDQIKTMVKNGNIIGAQTIILTELQTEFGGSAMAAAKAGAGGLVQLTNVWNDLKEVIGGAIVSIVLPLAEMGKEIISSIIPVEKLSKSLEDQKTRVNGLVLALSDANISDKLRIKLYNELKDIAPDVVKGIDSENLSVINLNKNLSIYNKNQLNRILLQRGQEGIDEAINKQADAFEFLSKASEKAAIEADKVYGKIVSGSDMVKKGAARQLNIDFKLGKIAIDEYIKGIGKLGGELGNFEQVTQGGVVSSTSKLQKALNQLTGAQSVYNDSSETATKLTESRIKLADKLGVDLSSSVVTANSAITDEIDETTKAVEKEITAYQKLSNKVSELQFAMYDLRLANQPVPDSMVRELISSQTALENVKKEVEAIALGMVAIQSKGANLIPTSGASPTLGKRAQVAFDNSTVAGPRDKIFGDKGEATQFAIEQAQVTADATFQIIADSANAELDLKLSNLEKEKEAKLANTKLTEAQRAKIEDDYNKKAAKLKTEQFKKDKAAAIIQAIINTALAVTKALPNAPQAIAAGIAGAAQIAVISAQKVPQFDSGIQSTPDTFIAGERRPEWMIEPSGRVQLVTKPTMFKGMAGATVIGGEQTRKMMEQGLTPAQIDIRPEIQAMRADIVSTIRNKRELHISGTGSKITERQGDYYKTYLFRKVSWADRKN
jgi:hypothetical protein